MKNILYLVTGWHFGRNVFLVFFRVTIVSMFQGDSNVSLIPWLCPLSWQQMIQESQVNGNFQNRCQKALNWAPRCSHKNDVFRCFVSVGPPPLVWTWVHLHLPVKTLFSLICVPAHSTLLPVKCFDLAHGLVGTDIAQLLQYVRPLSGTEKQVWFQDGCFFSFGYATKAAWTDFCKSVVTALNWQTEYNNRVDGRKWCCIMCWPQILWINQSFAYESQVPYLHTLLTRSDGY